LQLALHDYQLAKLSKIQLRQRLHLIQKELAKAKESLAETGGLALTAVIAERILECETEMAALEVKVADLKEKIEARRKEMKEIEEFVSLSARLEEQRAQIREMEGQIKKLEDEESTLARRMLDTRNFPNDRGRYIRVRSVDHIPAEQPGTFDVLGEVKNPGSQSLTEKTTLLKAIEGAGGFTENADQGRVVVIRRGGTRVSSRGPGGPPGRRTSAVERHVIDCGGLLGEEKGDDFTIEAGDMVIVPRKAESEGRPVAGSELERPRKFNIIGEVNKPGVYTLAPRTTVLRAIQTAGGFTRFSPRKVRVFRKVDDSVRRHEVDCAAILQGEAVDDFLIQPNDLLCVLRLE
jgi:protein involved in polysaccharide export with SLBB domain